MTNKNYRSRYLTTFFAEKNLPEVVWTLESPNGTANIIESGAVIEAIFTAPKHEQQAIANVIRRLDFANANVLDYLKHLAQALVRDL